MGKLSAIFGMAQIICVVVMFTITKGHIILDMSLCALTMLLIVSAVIFSSISFWQNEKPIAWAIAGLSISVFWLLWTLVVGGVVISH